MSAEKLKSCEASERFSAMESSWNERESGLLEQCQRLEEGVEGITRQNSLLHEEADKVHVCVGGWVGLAGEVWGERCVGEVGGGGVMLKGQIL